MLDELIKAQAKPSDSIYKRERWITRKELYILYTLIQEYKIERWIECGTANGFSSLVATESMLSGYSVDPIVHTFDIIDRPKLWNEEPFIARRERINFHHESYDVGLQNIATKIEKPTAFFIDGAHEGPQVLKDWEVTEPFYHKNDIVIFHDTNAYFEIRAIVKKIRRNNSYYDVSFINSERGVVTIKWK